MVQGDLTKCSTASFVGYRHLERKHSNEADGAKALSFPKNSKARRLQLDYMQNRGNFAHNTEIFESGKERLSLASNHREKWVDKTFCIVCIVMPCL